MREFSENATVSLVQRVTDEIWIVLLTMTIDGVVYRVVAGTNDPIVSNGETFEPYSFDVVLPADALETIEQVTLIIDNVDRLFMDALRAAQDPLEFTIQIALLSQPDIIELELEQLTTQQVEFDQFQIRATLLLNDILNQKFPGVGESYDPIQFPRLF